MKPLILVYTNHPMCSIDCADATIDVLNQSGLYDARMFGPDSHPSCGFNKDTLTLADCVVFPGGMGDADQFDDHLIDSKQLIQDYVHNGGKYLGICQGSYFAGKYYFDLLQGLDSVQYIKRTNACTRKSGATTIDISWKEQSPVPIYFHDGAAFVPTEETYEANVLGRYSNDDVAALIQSCGKGKVGVVGPHPEAQKWWFYSQSKIKDGWKNSIQHHMLLDIMEQLFV